MGFEGLLGNPRLKENLKSSLASGRLSHCYLISGPTGSGKRTLARLLAAAILCRGEGEKPCLRCRACRKVLAGTHPDVITVDDPEKKTVPVERIRVARAELYIRPNEAEKKILLIPRAQDLGIPGQNALLKVLEEPPGYGVFLLLTDAADKLLPTVRSRSTELELSPLPKDLLIRQLKSDFPQASSETISQAAAQSGGFLGAARALLEAEPDENAQAFAACVAQSDPVALLRLLIPMEKWKRDRLITQLQVYLELLQGALVCQAGLPEPVPGAREIGARRDGATLLRGVEALKKAIEYAQGNVSPAAVCGYLAYALR